MDIRRAAYRALWAAHRVADRVTGGRLDRLPGPPNLWLTTTGRKSGEPRTTPLYFVRDGDGLVVGASNAGQDRDPAWWLNLQARPEAEVRRRGKRIAVRARRATPAEEERLWPALERVYPPYRGYRTRTTRQIPLVVLEPIEP